MGILGKYWERKSERLRRKLGKLYEDRERLREDLIPYKIQSDQTPYSDRGGLKESIVGLAEIEKRLGERERSIFYKIFNKAYNSLASVF